MSDRSAWRWRRPDDGEQERSEPGQIQLHVIYRGQGVKWPLKADDPVEVYRGGQLITTVSGSLLIYSVGHYLDSVALAAQRVAQVQIEQIEADRRAIEDAKRGPAMLAVREEREEWELRGAPNRETRAALRARRLARRGRRT